MAFLAMKPRKRLMMAIIQTIVEVKVLITVVGIKIKKPLINYLRVSMKLETLTRSSQGNWPKVKLFIWIICVNSVMEARISLRTCSRSTWKTKVNSILTRSSISICRNCSDLRSWRIIRNRLQLHHEVAEQRNIQKDPSVLIVEDNATLKT